MSKWFEKGAGKRTEGCPAEVVRTSFTFEGKRDVHPLHIPFHIRWKEYQEACSRIFPESKRKLRSSKRLIEHYVKLKSFKMYEFSPIVNIKIQYDSYLVLLVVVPIK